MREYPGLNYKDGIAPGEKIGIILLSLNQIAACYVPLVETQP
jgi:hypothetical protein